MSEDRSRGNELARILVQSSIDGLFAIDRENRYTLWNSAMEANSGKLASEVLGRPMFEVFPFLRDLGIDRAVLRALGGEVVLLEAVRNVMPDGSAHFFDRHYMPLRDDGGAVVGMVGVVRDVTARRAAEEALRASEAALRTAVEAAGIGLWRWDPKKDELTWDAPLTALFGLTPGTGPISGDSYVALVHPEDRDRVRANSQQGVQRGGWEGEYRIVRADGTVRWVFSKSTMVRGEDGDVAHGAVIDVSDRRLRDEQARKAQRLEAVGQLTAGIAHNFNNILMALLPSLELAARKAPAELVPLLANAEQAATRAADLVRQLMTFAGRNRPKARTVEPIGALARRTVEFCSSTFDRRIAVVGTYDPDARARVDPAQIEQALANLVINGRDALDDAGAVDGPRITVRVDVVDGGATELSGREGEFVRLQVRDNGTGMDAQTVARVFEPFFTTKAAGRGTGLGLATTHAIIAEHGGFITCESEPRRGTTFTVYLPSVAEAPARVAAAVAAPLACGTETVLVVDDEAPIRRVVGKMLDSAGYAVELAGSGGEAIELLADPERASAIELVLLDVSMPGVSGGELRRRVRELAPRARVVVFTGYSVDAIEDADAVIQKPVTTARLLATIREVFDRP